VAATYKKTGDVAVLADETPPVNTSPHGPRNVRRIIRRCAIAGAIVACLWLLRGPILRMAAWPLVACEPAAGAKYLWIPSSPLGACCSPRYFDLVRDLYAEDRSRSVLIVRPVPERIVRMAAEPAFEQMVRDELARRGIPREAVIILPGPARNLWEECRCVAAWMGEQGGQRSLPAPLSKDDKSNVALLCDRFASGNIRLVLGRSAGAGELACVRVVSIANPRYDEDSWWQNRNGVKDFVAAWLARIYIRFHGEDVVDDDAWDPDAYERSIRPTPDT